MSSFTQPIEELLVSPLPDGKRQIVRSQFEFYWDNPSTGNREYIIVENGFDTDFASIPRIIWPILPPWGNYGKAAILHDRLYRYKEYTRKESDQIMKIAMEVLGVENWKINTIYWSLRAFGFIGWYKLSTFKGWNHLYMDKFIDKDT